MLSHRSSLLAFASLCGMTLAAFGPAFSTGPTADGTFIREGTSTLVVPPGNHPFAGFASLWVGMGTSNGDLVQAICDRHPGVGGSICEDITSDDDWCGYTYTLKASGEQPMGQEALFKAGDHFKMQYTYNDDTGRYDQYAYLNGEQVSFLSTDSGHAQGFGSAVECAATDCGTVPAHEWIDTVITMDVPDPNYGNTFGYNNADVTEFYTPDGGKTWKLDSAEIDEFTF